MPENTIGPHGRCVVFLILSYSVDLPTFFVCLYCIDSYNRCNLSLDVVEFHTFRNFIMTLAMACKMYFHTGEIVQLMWRSGRHHWI